MVQGLLLVVRIFVKLKSGDMPKRAAVKLFLFLLLKVSYKPIKTILMSLLEKEPNTKLEKWLTRIAIIAVAIWELIQQLIAAGAN